MGLNLARNAQADRPGARIYGASAAAPLQGSRVASDRDFAQHLEADLAGGDLAQRGDAGLVLGLDLRRVALAQHARAVGRGEHQLEAVRES